jgi:dTDP-4-amino-4,6-dideoxygalactose transaminase
LTKQILAIDGGPPVLTTPQCPWPVADEAIRTAVNDALADGSWGQYDGQWTESLIEKLQLHFGAQSVMLCSSGTIAVELALRGVGVRAEDEVILAGYDFPGNFRAIEAIDAIPVLTDVVPKGWVLDAEQVERALSALTTAIVVSHLHGQTADIETIRNIIAAHNQSAEKPVSIIEDACQVPGGKLNGKPLGSHGDVATFSFGGSKLLSAGRGGAVLSNDAAIIQRARIFAQRGNDAFPLSQLQAAVLGPQLDQLAEMTETRHRAAKILIEKTAHLSTLFGLKQQVADTQPAFYKLPWLLKDCTPGWVRSDFIHAVQAEGVAVGEGFRGFLRRSPRRCRKIGTLVNSQIAAQQTVLLHHPVLLQPTPTIELVGEAIEKVASNPR